MVARPCLDCGTITNGTRCPTHRRNLENQRTAIKRQHRPYTAAQRTRRANTVTAHRHQHGDWCPGWRRPPHHATDLTADHTTPVAAGGHENGPLTVLCRTCNSAKRDTTHE